MVRRFFREPLVHFLLLGAGLFLVYQLAGGKSGDTSQAITITQGQIEALTVGFSRTWQRPPTDAELAGLIQEQIRDEVYAREAIALGLDRDDVIIRRRLRQKMEFIAADLATVGEPTDDELKAWFKAHPAAFGSGPTFTFRQVFLDPARRRDTLSHDVEQLLARLEREGGDADISALGDSRMLEPAYDNVSTEEIEKQLGEKFAAALSSLTPGRWAGPIESAYGVHLVFLRERTVAHPPVFEEIKNAVRREWAESRRREMNEKVYQEMLSHYTVSIERPVAATPAAAETATAGAK